MKDISEMEKYTAALQLELRRCVDLLDGYCTCPDGSNADTRNAHALLGDFDEPSEVEPESHP